VDCKNCETDIQGDCGEIFGGESSAIVEKKGHINLGQILIGYEDTAV
jgi:hypothetical protein